MLLHKTMLLLLIVSWSVIIVSKQYMHLQGKAQVKNVCYQYCLLMSIYKNILKLFENISVTCFQSQRLDINLSISFVTFSLLYFTIWFLNCWSLSSIRYNRQSIGFLSSWHTVVQLFGCLLHIHLSCIKNILTNKSNPTIHMWYRIYFIQFLFKSIWISFTDI